MAKFNKPVRTNTSARGYVNDESATVNHEGGLAFKMIPEMELYTRCATSMFGEPKFYDKTGSDDKEILGLVETVSKTDPEFVLKLATYCRNSLNLRSVPIALLIESCKYPETKRFVRSATPHIIQRADELTEAMALYVASNGNIGDASSGGMMCNPLKRGLADSFHNFNEYEFAKYNRNGAVKLKDVLKVVHPAPANPEQSKLFARIKEDTLEVPDTWEVAISTKGSTKENWEAILPNMPFMARIRNLRNLLEKGVDVQPVIKMLCDEKAVAKSKQFPYRFFSAYREIEGLSNRQTAATMDALETALNYSIKNIPRFSGTTFISSDNSGSMDSAISEKSKIKRNEVGNLMSAMTHKFCDQSIVSVFGEDFKVVNLTKTSGIIDNMRKLANTNVGHSTNAYKAVKYLVEEKEKVDRIIIFSDEQTYDSRHRYLYGDLEESQTLQGWYDKYKRTVNSKVRLYSIDLAGHGTSSFHPKDKSVYKLAGWSEKVLQFIPTIEQDSNRILEEIRKTTIA